MRLGPGPVFVLEFFTSARRWQVYATRALFVTALLAAMFVVRLSHAPNSGGTSIQAQAQVGESYFFALIGTQLALVMLVAPAFTAGAICRDRAAGALAHVLVTDLTDAEIVLGKLGARLVPVIGLVACTFPLMSLGSLLGGIDPVALGLAFLVALAVAILSCSLSLATSVGATKTHEDLMAVYAFWTLVILFQPVWELLALSGAGLLGPPSWALALNPFWLSFACYIAPNQVRWTDFAVFLGASLALSVALMAVSIVRLRPVSARLAEKTTAARRPRPRLSLAARVWRLLPGPSLDGNPVLWREWHRNRSSRLTGLIWGAYFVCISYGGASSVFTILRNGLNFGPGAGVFVIMLGVGLGLLLLSVTASTSLSEERTSGSLELLLATRLSTRTILWGKWWGAYRVVPLMALWPTAIMAVFAFSPPADPSQPISGGARVFSVVLMAAIVLVHGAALTSLGLALATWVRRPGRAVGLCVAAYLTLSVGWIILVGALFPGGPNNHAESLACLSPIIGSMYLWEHVVFQHDVAWVLGVTTVCLALVAAAAVLLYALTLATFDRCLGRTPDRNSEPRPGPRPRPLRQSLASGHIAS